MKTGIRTEQVAVPGAHAGVVQRERILGPQVERIYQTANSGDAPMPPVEYLSQQSAVRTLFGLQQSDSLLRSFEVVVEVR